MQKVLVFGLNAGVSGETGSARFLLRKARMRCLLTLSVRLLMMAVG